MSTRSRSSETHDESALKMNPANMPEYNPAAPNGSFDLTKPLSMSHGNASAIVFADKNVRKNTQYNTSSGKQVTLQENTDYLERGKTACLGSAWYLQP